MDTVQPQQNKPAEQGSGFTNLSQYINANQNNQLGNVVGGGVQQAGQAATGAINQAGQQFQQAAGTEQQRLAGLGQGVQQSLGNLGNIQSSDVSNYQSALSGQGQGPTGLANTGALQQQAQSAQQQGQATGSQLGRYGLLQNYVGKGQQYGIGQQTFDSALLGQTGQQQLGQARAATAGLGSQANRAIASANAQGQQLQNQAQQLKQTAQQGLQQGVTEYDKSMQQKLATDQANQQSLIQQLSGVNGNSAVNVDPNVLAQLSQVSGGALNAGTNLYNVDLAPYLQANNLYANTQGVQSASDFAKAQGLGQLAGSTGLAGSNQGNILQQYLANQSAVGQYDANSPLNITNNAALTSALQTAGNHYNTGMKSAQDAIQGINNNLSGVGGIGAIQENLRDLYAQSQGIHGDNTQSAANQVQLQDALNWAKTQPVSNVAGYYSNALQGSVAGLAEQQQQLRDLPNQFDAFRVLQATPKPAQAVAANPILGNNGQPLTS